MSEALRLSKASAPERVSAIADRGSFQPLAARRGASRFVAGSARLHGQEIWIAATDPVVARGAIGVDDVAVLVDWLSRCRERPAPQLWLLDSAGARVDEGYPALGAFRTLYREALAARQRGTPMLALIAGSCFGGASLLACLCERRVYSEASLLAASGPRVIEARSGKSQLDAADPAAVRGLLGGAARARIGADEELQADSAEHFREAAARWLSQRREVALCGELRMHNEVLGGRLVAAGVRGARTDAGPISPELRRRLERLLPPGYEPKVAAGVLSALPSAGTSQAAYFGYLGDEPIGALQAWQLARELLTLAERGTRNPLVVVLDAPGHAATRADESVMVSQYLVHVSAVLGCLNGDGHRISLWIPGAASGAVFVVLAAPAQRVCALPSARIEVLAEWAARRVVGEVAPAAATPQQLIDAGVIDAWLDSRLEL